MQTRLEGAFGAERSCRFSLSLSLSLASPHSHLFQFTPFGLWMRTFFIIPVCFYGAAVLSVRQDDYAAPPTLLRRDAFFFKHNYCTCVSGVSFSCGAAGICVWGNIREKNESFHLLLSLDSFRLDSLNTSIAQVFIFEHSGRCFWPHAFSLQRVRVLL
jgi:hypothetical protein